MVDQCEDFPALRFYRDKSTVGNPKLFEEGLFLRASYPAASIFKLVTAAAAIEKKQIRPDTTIPYRGEFNRLSNMPV